MSQFNDPKKGSGSFRHYFDILDDSTGLRVASAVTPLFFIHKETSGLVASQNAIQELINGLYYVNLLQDEIPDQDNGWVAVSSGSGASQVGSFHGVFNLGSTGID